MNIKRFDEFINESYLLGARAPLYHTTQIYFASEILDQNLLAGRNTGRGDFEKVISLTRDKNFIYDDYPVTFVLDQDALKKDHNIVPFDFFSKQNGLSKDNPKRKDFEFEETVKGDIKNLHKYLLEIRINDSISLYKNATPNTREELREAYDDLMYSLKKYKDQYGIKVVNSNGKEYNIESEQSVEMTLESKQEGAPLSTTELNKIKTFYHATSKANLGSIMNDGIKKGKIEKVVYLSDSSQNAAKFLAIRGMKEIIVFPIDASKLDKKELEESFDHSYDFFKCRAYLYYGDIPEEAIDFDKIMQYL